MKIESLRRRQRADKNRGFAVTMKHTVSLFLCLVVSCYALGFFLIMGPSEPKAGPDVKQNAAAPADPTAAAAAAAAPETKRAPAKTKNDNKSAQITIGFAVTITGCGSDPITEGAAVLKHAIHLASVHGNLGGRYDYKMYAIYHPDGYSCAAALEDLGFTLLKRETPVAVKDIQGEFLRENIVKNGCCGEKELVKLEAYTLTDHPVVVHLDLDVVVLKPMDALFDWMLADPSDSDHDTSDVPIMWPELRKPKRINAFFTRDCKFE
jgi:hypothetical protein